MSALAGPMLDRVLGHRIAEDALASVFDVAVVAGLRDDSPLSALGMTAGDAVCVADAVAGAAALRGLTCEIGDVEFADLATVADLVTVILTVATIRPPGGSAGAA